MTDESFYHCIVCRSVKYLEGNESERTMECKECEAIRDWVRIDKMSNEVFL